MRRHLQSIQGQIIILVIAIVMVSGSAPVLMVLSELQQQLELRSSIHLKQQTQIQAQTFTRHVDAMIHDVELAANSPELLNYITASGDHTEQLRREHALVSYFRALLQLRPHYAQLRFIDHHGMEVLRLDHNRASGKIHRIPTSQLQDKSHRDYVIAGLALAPGQYHLSRIDLNRELGKIVQPAEPTLRVSRPIHSAESQLQGMLVINQRVTPIFDEMGLLADPGYTELVIDQDGNYLRHFQAEKAYAFEFGETLNAFEDFPGVDTLFNNGKSSGFFASNHYPHHLGGVIAAQAISYNPLDTEQKIGIIALGSHGDINAVAANTTRAATALIVLALIAAVAIGLVAARRIAQPFRHMIDFIHHQGSGDKHRPPAPLPECTLCAHAPVCLRLPVEHRGEAGSLARVLRPYLCEIRNKTNALQEQVALTRQAHHKAEQANRALARTNQELEQFVYITAHDLRSPLRVIDNASAWLIEDLQDSLSGEQLENLQLLRQRSLRMEKLLDDLLEYSQVDNRLLHGTPQKCASCSEILENLSLLVEQRTNAHLQIEQPLPDLQLPQVPIQHVLSNLINNAIKHNDKEDILVTLRVSEQGEQVRFEVEDNGPGIDPAYSDKVFQLFQTLRPRDQVEGSGLGLAIVKKILDYCGGNIELHTAPGGGCLFVVWWPKQPLTGGQ